MPIYLNKHTNSTAQYQTGRFLVCSKNLRGGSFKKHSYPAEYQVDTPLENHQNWFDNCPIARTKPCPASLAGRFRTRAGGLRLFTVTPPLNPLPWGGDSAAEAAVRLQAKSLRSEGASIQRQCSAEAVLFVLLTGACG